MSCHLCKALLLTTLCCTLAGMAVPQSNNSAAAEANAIPVIDGGIGPCTADFTVTDGASKKPIYDAKVSVHIKYGFGNFHKMDLQVGTNVDGKARFTGLPDKLNHGLYFHATKGELSGEVFDDTSDTCKAQFTMALEKTSQ